VILQDDTGFCLLQQQASSLSLSKVLERSCMRITYSQFPTIFFSNLKQIFEVHDPASNP
jgi:hypothetical protein